MMSAEVRGRRRRHGRWLLLAWLVLAVASAAWAAEAPVPAGRQAALCACVQATGASDIEALLGTSKVGKRSFDDVYGQWYHSVGMAKDLLGPSRRARFYEVLKGLVALDARLLADDPQALGLSAAEMPKVRALLDAGKSFGKGFSDGDIDLALLQKLLLSTGAATLNVEFLKELFAGQKVAADVACVLAAPVAASDRAAGAVRAIRAGAEDADLKAACERLLGEIETGKRDYTERVIQALGDGKTAQWLQKRIAEGAAAALILKPLLSQLGFISAAGRATSIVGLLFAGTEIGMSLTGESQAYPHARLAHFADAIKPGLLKQWQCLRDELNATDAEGCAAFDAACRAAILVDGFVNQEGRLMQEAYRKATVARDAASAEEFGAEARYAAMYRGWVQGATFAAYAIAP
jgi:hypothetical protein